jgi:hypothetical protein
LGKIFLDLSKKGLEKRNELEIKVGKNETIYLSHIEEIIGKQKNSNRNAD